MPNLNGTGPKVRCRLTGRGLGNCDNSLQQRNFVGKNRRPGRNFNNMSNQSRDNNFILEEINLLKKSIAEILTKLNYKN